MSKPLNHVSIPTPGKFLNHTGIHLERIKCNPKEAAFARAWYDVQAGRTMPALLCGETGNPLFDQRDATVAATVIQWLGTQPGIAFVDQVRRTFGYIGEQ